jgi:hypothetical protein
MTRVSSSNRFPSIFRSLSFVRQAPVPGGSLA